MAEAFINIHERALTVEPIIRGNAHLPLYLSGSGAPINHPLDNNVAWHPSFRLNQDLGYIPASSPCGDVDGNSSSLPAFPYPYIIPPFVSPVNSSINSCSTKDSANDSNESPSTPTKAPEENGDDKKEMKATPRGTRWKKEQLAMLEQHYANNKYPDKKDKCEIALSLEVTVSKVSSWFIGRRSRDKRTAKRKENLDESLESTLTDEKLESGENMAACDMNSPRRDSKNRFTQLMEKPPSDLINRHSMASIIEFDAESGNSN